MKQHPERGCANPMASRNLWWCRLELPVVSSTSSIDFVFLSFLVPKNNRHWEFFYWPSSDLHLWPFNVIFHSKSTLHVRYANLTTDQRLLYNITGLLFTSWTIIWSVISAVLNFLSKSVSCRDHYNIFFFFFVFPETASETAKRQLMSAIRSDSH